MKSSLCITPTTSPPLPPLTTPPEPFISPTALIIDRASSFSALRYWLSVIGTPIVFSGTAYSRALSSEACVQPPWCVSAKRSKLDVNLICIYVCMCVRMCMHMYVCICATSEIPWASHLHTYIHTYICTHTVPMRLLLSASLSFDQSSSHAYMHTYMHTYLYMLNLRDRSFDFVMF
jgi:hypothetical protein